MGFYAVPIAIWRSVILLTWLFEQNKASRYCLVDNAILKYDYHSLPRFLMINYNKSWEQTIIMIKCSLCNAI